MKKYLTFIYLFMFLILGCGGGGSSGGSPANINPRPSTQKITRCEAYELGAKCLSDSMQSFGTYVGYQTGQSIEVRQAEDLMTASSENGLNIIEFDKAIELPDFGDSVYKELKFIAKKQGQAWFTFSTANARDLNSSSLSVSYSNTSFGYKFEGNMMNIMCSNGDRYSIDNFVSAYNDCKSKTFFPFTNVTSFDYTYSNQCGVKVGLHAIASELWFISIYKPLSNACK